MVLAFVDMRDLKVKRMVFAVRLPAEPWLYHLASSVTLGNVLRFFEPQFPPLRGEGNNAQELPNRVVRGLNGIMNVKGFAQGSWTWWDYWKL